MYVILYTFMYVYKYMYIPRCMLVPWVLFLPMPVIGLRISSSAPFISLMFHIPMARGIPQSSAHVPVCPWPASTGSGVNLSGMNSFALSQLVLGTQEMYYIMLHNGSTIPELATNLAVTQSDG